MFEGSTPRPWVSIYNGFISAKSGRAIAELPSGISKVEDRNNFDLACCAVNHFEELVETLQWHMNRIKDDRGCDPEEYRRMIERSEAVLRSIQDNGTRRFR